MIDEEAYLAAVTFTDRAVELGWSLEEQRELEAQHPWWRDPSARYGRGVANMRSWLDAGRPRADLGRLCVSGAPIAVRKVRELVKRIPVPIAWHLVETTAITWMPPGLGLTGPWPTPPRRPEGKIEMAFQVTERSLGLVAHEIGHAWHRDPELFANLTPEEIEMLDEMVAAAPGAFERTERSHESEDAADRLASVLLGLTVDTSRTRDLSSRLAHGMAR